MIPGTDAPLRIALVSHDHGFGGTARARHVRQLGAALQEAGHQPQVIAAAAARPRRVVDDGLAVRYVARLGEGLLRRRGFAGPLSHLPTLFAALSAGRFDVVHAFTTPDAQAALAWRRRARRPVVFTCVEPLRREVLADRRLTLWMLRGAVEDTDAVLAVTPETQSSLSRWMAQDVPVLDADDAPGHLHLYRGLAGSADCASEHV